MPDFIPIVQKFQFEGIFIHALPYGNGHINDSYAAHFHLPSGGDKRYLLQRINQNVFKNPGQVMDNIVRITRHLREKISQEGGNPERETLNIIPTVNGNSYHVTENGDYWRAFILIEGANTYERVEQPELAYQASKAFGKFQRLLSDFPPDSLHETIPDFHHTLKRFTAFQEAIQKDIMNRAADVKNEIAFVMQRADETSTVVDLLTEGQLLQRVTHNDTKLDNVLIDDQSGKSICVIDLDTVMPGPVLYDFGDSIRSGANPAVEDDEDLNHVYLDLTLFECYARGYLEEIRSHLTLLEIEHLAFSARLITLEQTIRFLMDYINGDIYYKIHRPDHNLHRCRNQMQLLKDMEKKYDQMVQIVDRYR
jgi:hypothetical protein